MHHLKDLPAYLSPVEACLFAKVRCLEGNDTDAIRLLRNGAFVIDTTEELDDLSDNYLKFWHDTVRWLIRHRNGISDDDANIILNWTMHQYTETKRDNRQAIHNWEVERQTNDRLFIENQRQLNPPRLLSFSMKGRSLQRVLEQSYEYLSQQSRPWSDYSWKNHGWDFTFDDTSYSRWEIIELTNGKELYMEGQSLGHCVSGYAGRCVANASAIFSMRKNGQRIITIEVNPNSKGIIQARGKHNRSAGEKEQEIIVKWRIEKLIIL